MNCMRELHRALAICYTEDASVLQAKKELTEKMGSESASTSRKPRADSLRNRERLLIAARDVFSAGGPDASLEAVARKAGVGIGTLYRHFPTRESIFQAVYRREIDQLVELSVTLAAETGPLDALRRWLHAQIGMVATKKGMLAALAPAAGSSTELFAYSSEQMTRSVSRLMAAAVAAGEIRDDLEPEDIMRALIGMCYTREQAGWQEKVERLVDVFVDGLTLHRDSR